MKASKLARILKPYIVSWIQEGSTAVAGGGSGGLTTHALDGPYHSGTLDDAQAPQFLKTDGSRALTGDLSVASGVAIDGVDISDHAGNANAHHAAFVGLKDQYGTNVDPDAGNRVTVRGVTGGGVTATASTNKVDLAVDSTVVRTSRTITAGAGLTGAGDLSADRTIDVGAGTGITVNADNVAVNQAYNFNWTGTHSWGATTGVYIYPTGNVNVGPDVYLPLDGLIAAGGTFHVNIDSDNSSTVAGFVIRHDGNTSDAAEVFRVNESGNVTATGNVSAVAGTFSGAVTVAQDFTVGANVLFVDQSQANVGINRAPDAQFALDVSGPARADWFVGPHAIQLEDADIILHFDGPRPYNTDFGGSLLGHMGQAPSANSGGVIFVPGKFGKAIELGQGATNYITNPSFETGTTGWSPNGTVTLVRTNEESYVGGYSLKITTDGSAAYQGAISPSTSYNSGETWTASVWVKRTDPTVAMRLSLRQGATAIGESVIPTGATDWQRVHVTATTTASGSDLRFYVQNNNDTTVHSFYVDGAQLEKSGYPTPYLDGSLGDGYSWTGTAHASTSTRTNGVVAYEKPDGWASPDKGTLMAWVKFPMNIDGVVQSNGWDDSLMLVGAGENNNSCWLRWRPSDDKLEIRIQARSVNAVSKSGLLVGAEEWHHYAWTWDSLNNTCSVYFDGVQQATNSFSGFGEILTKLKLKDNSTFPGVAIDDLVVLNRSASADEIRAIYESNAPVFAESSVFAWRSPSASPVWVDEEGLWVQDTAGTQVLGVYAGDSTKSWGGLSLTAGDVLIGNSGNGYIHWDNAGSSLSIQDASLAVGSVFSADPATNDVQIGNYSPYGAFWDNSAGTMTVKGELHLYGNSSFDGVVGIGTSGGIYQGTGSFSSPTTGLKLYNSGGVGRLAGYNGGVEQAAFDTDGKLKAGAGSVIVDNDGISITSSSSYTDPTMLKWKSGADKVSWVKATYVSGQSTIEIGAGHPAGVNGFNTAYVGDSATNTNISVTAPTSPATGYSSVVISSGDWASSNHTISFYAGTAAVGTINSTKWDIPIPLEADALQATTTAGEGWTSLSYASGWSTYSGSWNSLQYKRLGDLVFVRGMVTSTNWSANSGLIATLPTGYRPSKKIMITTTGNVNAHVRVDITASGQILYNSGGAGSGWLNLDGIVFSVQ